MVPILTDAGRNALLDQGGVDLSIKSIALGAGLGTPSPTEIALLDEKERVDVQDSELSNGQLRLQAEFIAIDQDYNLGEWGVFLDDGTLMAIFRQSTPIGSRSAFLNFTQDFVLSLNGLPSENVNLIINNGGNLDLDTAIVKLAKNQIEATRQRLDLLQRIMALENQS